MAGYASAVSWFDGITHIRVYTCKDQQVTEGTQVHLRVYSVVNNKIVEQCWDKDGWYKGAFTANGIGVSATSWIDSAGSLHLRVYCRAENGGITEQCWDGRGPWRVGAYQGVA